MPTTTQEIARQTWRQYFDELSRTLGTVVATVEIVGPDVGAQVEADRLVLTGITYDDRDDVLVVGLDAPGGPPEDLERMIERPQKILVATGDPPPVEMTIDVQDAEGNQTIISIERPPALPPE
ncbi:MAG: hypothetical protein QOD24_1108 [Solirubrobacteraceae bacterium]|nr:hypothetical protein [Solirubrobacteraceae bacterium]